MAQGPAAGQGRREEVLRAAARVFSERGYRSSTLQDIARELGFTSAAIYYYFDSKECMLNELIMRPIRMLNEEAQSAADLATERKLHRVRRLVRRHIALIVQERELFTILLRERVELGTEATAELAQLESDYSRRVRELLDVCVAAGEIAPRDTRLAALALIGMLNWVIRWYTHEGPLSPDEVAEEFFEIFHRGVVMRHEAAI